ncbi:PAS domain-containing sensor histidine kinase, partial [Elusimicrobiota bacterium]
LWLGGKERAAMEAILRAIATLQERLEQMVDFTRPLELKPQPVGVEALIESATQEVAQQCDERHIRVVTEIPEDVSGLKGDPDRLKEALLQILINSIEAMPDGGTITVMARMQAGRKGVRIEVRDTGGGVASEHVKEVGRPFFTMKAAGVGLGVAIARRILAAHGGSFEFHSTEGKGSTATMTLPATPRRG